VNAGVAEGHPATIGGDIDLILRSSHRDDVFTVTELVVCSIEVAAVCCLMLAVATKRKPARGSWPRFLFLAKSKEKEKCARFQGGRPGLLATRAHFEQRPHFLSFKSCSAANPSPRPNNKRDRDKSANAVCAETNNYFLYLGGRCSVYQCPFMV